MDKARRRPLLVLEDSDEDFDTVREAIQVAGLPNQVQRATTGDDCLALLRSGANRPAIVLLDLNTPGRDGRDALREIKSDPALSSVPVVILTTSSNPRDVDFCYASGANAYHVKPIRYVEHVEVLLALFRYWLGSVVPPGSERIAT